MSTVIGLLRHGQTDWNIDMRLQGISDIPMNETGHTQARAAAEVLAAQDWHDVISSPLDRAQKTAQYVADALGIESVATEDLLLERSFGEAEGSSYEEWRERLQAGIHATGAESIEDLELRSWKLLDVLAANFIGQRVIAVSHGALIRKIISLVSDGELPREGERFGNASLTVIEFADGKWSILDYNPKSLGH
jgi:broad specificity phosphatase PhoE